MRSSLGRFAVLAILFGTTFSCRPQGGNSARSDEANGKTPATRPDSVADQVGTVTIQHLLQMTIDNPKLAPYFHVEQLPGRVPLVILLNDVVKSDYELSKFGRPVIFKRESVLAKDEPFLEVTTISIEGVKAQVKFRYPPEGVWGTVTFQKPPAQNWVTATTKVWEE